MPAVPAKEGCCVANGIDTARRGPMDAAARVQPCKSFHYYLPNSLMPSSTLWRSL
jgi:hypothetical protein